MGWDGIIDTDPAQLEMKSQSRKGELNFYITGLKNGILGYATLPEWYSGKPLNDGVVVLTNSIPGGSSAPVQL
jgi:hypothetical protein